MRWSRVMTMEEARATGLHSRFVELSLRENGLNGVPEDHVWKTRLDPLNAYRLKDDSFIGNFRFLVAYERDCSDGLCQVWVNYFTTYEDAKAFLDAHAERGENGSLYAILPAGFSERVQVDVSGRHAADAEP